MRTEVKVMNIGKLQAKQEKLKSLHCPSPQSSLFNSRDSLLNTRLPQHLFVDISADLLRQGQSVRFRAPGQSMHPTIKEGETITVAPVAVSDIRRGDILLYKLGKKVVAHRVVSIKREKNNSTSHSLACSSIRASTPSLTYSSTHSSTQASTNSKTLNRQLIFILRGDASLTCDEPVGTHQILGKVVSVEKRGRSLDLYSRKTRIFRFAYAWTSRLKRLILHILNVYHEAGLALGGFR
jgi:signal peptidase I